MIRNYITPLEELKTLCQEKNVNFLELTGKECQYCGKETEFVNSKVIYGKSYGMIYLCISCNAYVGTYSNTDRALGCVANEDLRKIRNKTHVTFDSLWNGKNELTYFKERQDAYNWLADKMGRDVRLTHVGMFTVEDCKQVLDICENFTSE